MMKAIEIKPQTILKAKGFDISIGKSAHQIALISKSTGDFTPLDSVKKSKRLAKAKRAFKTYLSSTTHFFFEGMSEQDTLSLLSILK